MKFSTVLVPVLDPASQTAVRLVGFARDMTHQDRLQELHRDKLASDAASQAKSVFLSKMSHEIRTPLNAVLGFARLLLQDPRLDESQRSHLATIDRNGEVLLSLINDILELSKIEASKVVLRQVDCSVRELLAYVRATFEPMAHAKSLGFSVHCAAPVPTVVALDQGKLRQILLNLVGNAVKFTQAGAVRVEADMLSEGRLRVRVIDSGPGLSPQEIALLFRDFEQTELGRQAGGSGLGLTISRGYARLMGGDVEVQSSPGNGSVFSVSVPCEPREVLLPAERTAPLRRYSLDRSVRPVRLLVVDDVSDNRVLLSTLLRQAGFEVREATNGREAVQAVGLWQPHAAILDLKMPDLDGITAAQQLRMLYPRARLKILGMSASVFRGEEEQFHAAGADAFLPKPVRNADILETLGRLLELAYVNDEGEPAQLPETASKVATEPMPETLRISSRALAQAVEEGDYQGIKIALESVEQDAPKLAAEVRRLLVRFDYEAILRRIERCT